MCPRSNKTSFRGASENLRLIEGNYALAHALEGSRNLEKAAEAAKRKSSR